MCIVVVSGGCFMVKINAFNSASINFISGDFSRKFMARDSCAAMDLQREQTQALAARKRKVLMRPS